MTEDLFGEPISTYTRAQAVEDGVLVELDREICREAGFRWPIAVTRALFDILAQPNLPGQDCVGRTWDMLTILRLAGRRGGERVDFAPLFIVKSHPHGPPMPVKMYAVCGPGDTLEPVVTVMLDGED